MGCITFSSFLIERKNVNQNVKKNCNVYKYVVQKGTNILKTTLCIENADKILGKYLFLESTLLLFVFELQSI